MKLKGKSVIIKLNLNENESNNILRHHIDNGYSILENARYFGYSVESSTIKGRKLDMK